MWKSGPVHDIKMNMKMASGGDKWERDIDIQSGRSAKYSAAEQEPRRRTKTPERSCLLEPQERLYDPSKTDFKWKVSQVQEALMKNLKQQPKASSGHREQFTMEKTKDQLIAEFIHTAKKDSNAVHQDGGKFGAEKKNTSRVATGPSSWGQKLKLPSQREDSPVASAQTHVPGVCAKDFGGSYKAGRKFHHRHAVTPADTKCSSTPYQRWQPSQACASTGVTEALHMPEPSAAGTVAALKVCFEDTIRVMNDDSRKQLEKKVNMAQQQKQSNSEKNAEIPALVPKTLGVLRMLPESSRKQMQEMIWNPGQVQTEPTGQEVQTDSDSDGEYENMDKAMPRVDDGDYIEVMSPTSAVAMYSYQGEMEDELSFNVNDIITHLEMLHSDWWRGCCQGRVGLFPSSFVRLLW